MIVKYFLLIENSTFCKKDKASFTDNVNVLISVIYVFMLDVYALKCVH